MKHFKKLAVICFIASIIFFKFFIQDLFCLSLFLDKQSIWNSLILFGAEINGKNLNGTTPLHLAAALGLADSVKLCIESGGKINQICKCGKTPLDCAFGCSLKKQDIRKEMDLPPIGVTLDLLKNFGGKTAKKLLRSAE